MVIKDGFCFKICTEAIVKQLRVDFRVHYAVGCMGSL